MTSLIDAARDGVRLLQRNNDDRYDRLSSRYSVAICLIFSILVSSGVYIGDPISCWAPAQFTGQWVRFTEQYCWIKNTYYVPLNERISKTEEHQNREIAYYQWTAIILAVQALLFSLPMLLWKTLSKEGGYDIHLIVTTCRSSDLINPEKRDAVIRYLTMHFDRLLSSRLEYWNGSVSRFRRYCEQKCGPCGKRYGNYLVVLYLISKCLCTAVALAQLFALNWIVGSGSDWYGLKAFDHIINQKESVQSPFFPLFTLCDFRIRGMGYQLQSNTVQCVLPYNVFNEIIFIFMWWWLVFVSAMSTFGLFVWLFDVTTQSNIKFVTKYLLAMSHLSGENKAEERMAIEMFVKSYLRRDGMFVLRMVAEHASDITTAELVCSLWDNFLYKFCKAEDL
jgi:innexin